MKIEVIEKDFIEHQEVLIRAEEFDRMFIELWNDFLMLNK